MKFWILTYEGEGWVFLTEETAKKALKKIIKNTDYTLSDFNIQSYKVQDPIILNSLKQTNPEYFL